MTHGKIIGVLSSLRRGLLSFFNSRCLVGFPWYWPSSPPGRHAMTEARRLVRQHFGRDHHRMYSAAARLLAAVVWVPAALLHLAIIRNFRGAEAVPMKRSPGALWAALRHNVLPGEYYAYELWQPGRRAQIDNYLYSNEAARLFKLLNRPSRSDPINDKLAFFEMCRAQGIPTPAVLAAFAPSGMLLGFESGQPPQQDVFVKPRLGRSGDGAERLRWGNGVFESNRGCRIGPEEISDYLSARARKEHSTLLVQPALANDPVLRVESNGALATARLVTGRSPDGGVVPIFGFIYFPRLDRITAQHGEVALIDVENGCLMSLPSTSAGTIYQYRRVHSEYDGKLPEWGAALQYTKVAHQTCGSFVFVGWDVAFTDHGPMLLEGNANWGADEYQALRGEPLGCTKFTEVLAAHLKKLRK